MLDFSIVAEEPRSAARAAELATPHGVVKTPAFMPVGTAGTVKGVAAWELERLAPQMILANTYHLILRPGVERLKREIISVLAGEVTPSWRVLPAIEILLAIARLRRAGRGRTES